MRCCTIFLCLTAVISIPVIFAFFYLDWDPKQKSIVNSSITTTNTRAPSSRPPQYTQNWPDKDSYIIRASSTVLGRGTLTTAGQFDVSTGSPSSSLPETTNTPNKPIQTTTTTTSAPTTTTTTTTTTSTTTTTTPPPPSTSASSIPTETTTIFNASRTLDLFGSQPSIESSPKPFVALTTPGSTEELRAWTHFKDVHRRRYPSLEEEEKRRNIFIENKRLIDTHNAKPNNLFTMGINKFADYSNEEINSLFIGPKQSQHITTNYPPRLEFLSESETLPKTLDYRNTTAGEPVDQALCLDSAVYAAIGSIESAANLARQSDDSMGSASPIAKLSELQVIDCLKSSQVAKSDICSGKVSLAQVFELLQKVPTSGLVSNKEYLEHQNSVLAGFEPAQVCNISQPEEKVTMNSYGIVQQEHILEALANSGPLAFPIDARQSSFHFYSSGIYHSLSCSMEEYNYHSLLIGFIPEQNNTESHYIIRNSLGTDWGEGGYMRLLRNVDRNKCLPQKMAVYPNLG